MTLGLAWQLEIKELRAENSRLKWAGHRAFLAMCDQRDYPDAKRFQGAIDALAVALSMGKSDE